MGLGGANERLEIRRIVARSLGNRPARNDQRTGGGSTASENAGACDALCGHPLWFQAFHFLTEAAFVSRVTFVKERILQREKEVTGEWLTEERMKNKHNWGKHRVRIQIPRVLEEPKP